MAPMLHAGLSTWIIQDRNSDDFFVGQEAKFALAFSPQTLPLAEPGPKTADRLAASRYHIHGEVVFIGPGVWVIDVGLFMAYRNQAPPAWAEPGMWVEGDIYLGIDPFFYFEELQHLQGMPPLGYDFVIRGIVLETTPWIGSKDEQGRTINRRDKDRELFVPVRKTNGWEDIRAHYVLECEKLAGPERP